MAYCKPTYTVLRNGIVIANHTTAENASAAVQADIAKFCPTPCNVQFLDVAFDGTEWTIGLTPDSTAPFLLLLGDSEDGNIIISPAPDFPATIADTDLFAGGNQQSISVIGATTESPGEDDACSSDTINFNYPEIIANTGEVELLLPTSLDDCTGAITYSVLYTNATTAQIVAGTLTITDNDATTTYVGIYCDGLIHGVYVYEVPALSLGLRLTYNSEGDVPANDLAAWNTFFNLPTNGTPFTSFTVSGAEVTLFGGAGITVATSLFLFSSLAKFEDDGGIVVSVSNGCFAFSASLTTVYLPAISTPYIGFDATDNNIFANCAALTSITVPTALATADTGSPDGDLVYAAGTLGATITYV